MAKEKEDTTRVFTWDDVFYIVEHPVIDDSKMAWHLGVPVSVIRAFRTLVKKTYADAPRPTADELRVIPHRDRCAICRVRRQTTPTADGKKHLCTVCAGLVEAFNLANKRTTSTPSQEYQTPRDLLGDELRSERSLERRYAPGGSWDPNDR